MNDRSDTRGLSSNEMVALGITGYIFLRHMRHEESIALFEAINCLSADNKHAMRCLIFLYHSMERYGDAKELINRYNKMIDSDSDRDLLTGLLESKVLWGAGDIAGAKEVYKRYSDISKLGRA